MRFLLAWLLRRLLPWLEGPEATQDDAESWPTTCASPGAPEPPTSLS